MDNLIKKINILEELLKGLQTNLNNSSVLPSIKQPSSKTNIASGPKIPSVAPSNKKNPIKQAEQIKNKDFKDIKMREAREALNINKSTGQWSLGKDCSADSDIEKEEKKWPKPNRPGTFPNESHVLDTVDGHRTVRYPKSSSNGKDAYGHRKVPNKVKVTHIWDHDNKEWKYSKHSSIRDSENKKNASQNTIESKKEEAKYNPGLRSRLEATGVIKPEEKKPPKQKTIRRPHKKQ